MSHLTNITLKIWRQAGPSAPGRFEDYTVPSISDEASFLEMLDVLNEQLIADGKEAIVFDHDCREGICGTCSLMIDKRSGRRPHPAARIGLALGVAGTLVANALAVDPGLAPLRAPPSH